MAAKARPVLNSTRSWRAVASIRGAEGELQRFRLERGGWRVLQLAAAQGDWRGE